VTLAEHIYYAVANRPAVKKAACRADRRQSVKAESAQTAATLRLVRGPDLFFAEFLAEHPRWPS
jgi:hypothetical protein